MSFRTIVIFLTIWVALTMLSERVMAQDDEPKPQKYAKKIDRKVSLSPSLGIGIFPSVEVLNLIGESKNIYSGFTPMLNAGFALNLLLHKNNRFYLSTEMNVGVAKRVNYSLLVGSLNAGAKVFLLNKKYKLNPFLTAGIGLTMVDIARQKYSLELDTNGKIIPGNIGTVVKYEKDIEAAHAFYPVLSPYIGGGVQYAIDKKYSIFLQATYNPTLGTSPAIVQKFPANQDPLQYAMIKGGVTIQLMKPKPPWVDTAIVPIRDVIAMLDVPEEGSSDRGMLAIEGKFDLAMREGLKHNLRVDIKGNSLLIEEEITDPCKVACYLYDQNGHLVSQAESTPEGKIIFSDLEKGIYDVTFVLEKPCTSANFSYRMPDPNEQPTLQYNEEGTINDTINYRVEGNVVLGDSSDNSFIYKNSVLFVASNNKMANTNYDITVFLANDVNKVIKKNEPEKDQRFLFKNLKEPKANLIYKVPDSEIRTGLSYTIMNNFRTPVQSFFYQEVPDSMKLRAKTQEDVFFDQLRFNIKGKATLLDSATKMEDINLYLVNANKKIVAIKKPEKDGSFIFKNLKSKVDYQVYYEFDNPNSNAQVVYKNEEPVVVPVKDLPDIEIQGKRMVPELAVSPGFKIAYTVKGNLINPHGYGVYVGAFENIVNVDRLVKKLLKNGFNSIAIQVLMTKDLNKVYQFTRDFKIHRILVGEFTKEREAKKTQEELDKLGYDAYIIKHFDEL